MWYGGSNAPHFTRRRDVKNGSAMKARKKKPQHKKPAKQTPAPKPTLAPKPEPGVVVPALPVFPTYLTDIEGECARRGHEKVDDESSGRICTLSNEDVLNGRVPFENVAAAIELLMYGKIHKDDVSAVKAGIDLWMKLHPRGIRNQLAIVERTRPDGAITDTGMEMSEDVVERFARMVWPETDFERKRSVAIIPDKVWNHPAISKLIHDPPRFVIAAAGFRSWKTMLALLFTIAQAILHPDTHYFLASPTHDQTKRIFWERLNLFTPREVIHAVRDGELTIYFKNKSSIHLLALDSIRRAEGKATWHGAVVDEAGDAEYNVFDTNVRTMLADSRGWCWVIGRARQTKSPYFKELKDRALSGAEGYGFFTWKSSEILDEVEIADIKSTMSPALYAQECEAEFQELLGRAYGEFDKDIHVKDVPFDPEHDPLVLTWDFNVNPCVAEIGIERPGRFFAVIDEVSDANTNTFRMCALAKQHIIALFGGNEARAKQQRLDMYGDYAGNQKTTNATYSNWGIIKEAFADWNATFHLKPSPHIIDRVNAVNGRMRSADGQVHFAVSPKCTLLINDFANMTMEEVMKEREVEQSRSHASDACGYWIEFLMGGMKMQIG